MKTSHIANTLAAALASFASAFLAQAQGTMDFNDPWINNGLGGFSLFTYDPMSFRIGPYPPAPIHNDVSIVGATGPAGYPHNGTPYIAFINTYGNSQSVVFAWTNAAASGHSFTNGAPFGLTSVDLADPVAPSLAPVSITFDGFRADGSMVSQTFTTPGGGAITFQTYSFGPDFGSGLVRVEIPSAAWAMDNLVWVPEPNSLALLGLGLLGVILRKRQARAACVKVTPPTMRPRNN